MTQILALGLKRIRQPKVIAEGEVELSALGKRKKCLTTFTIKTVLGGILLGMCDESISHKNHCADPSLYKAQLLLGVFQVSWHSTPS
jgi:hypothetical protein